MLFSSWLKRGSDETGDKFLGDDAFFIDGGRPDRADLDAGGVLAVIARDGHELSL